MLQQGGGWGAPSHTLLLSACTSSACEPVSTWAISNLVMGARRRLEREEGKEEGSGAAGGGGSPAVACGLG